MADAPPIVAEHIDFAYGRGSLRKQILFDVSAEVGAGEIVILTGPSGSGKTTLLTMMGALRTSQEGSLRIFGEELRGASEKTLVQVRRRIGYIFQSHNLLPALDVSQNVRMGLQLHGRATGAEAKTKIEGVLDRVGMAEHLHKRVGQLSGGQRQRVAIARALVHEPGIVLADEPTASLDKESGRDVANLIQELAKERGASVVLVTHDNRILDIADRILHLEDGRITSFSEAVASDTNRMLGLLAEHDPRAHRTLMGFATALARVAHADRSLRHEEVEVIRETLLKAGNLAPGEAEFVMTIALESVGSGDSEGDGIRNNLQRLEPTERRRLLDAMRAVAEADGDFSESEREEIERIAAELGEHTVE